MVFLSCSPLFLGSIAFSFLLTGYLLSIFSIARSYKLSPIYSANSLFLAFLILISLLIVLETINFVDTYIFSISFYPSLNFWKLSFFFAIMGISAYQLRFSNLMHQQWKLIYPVGFFAGGLTGISFSTLGLQNSSIFPHPGSSSRIGEFLIVFFYILLTIPAVLVVSISRHRYGQYYSKKILHSSKYELMSAIMLFSSSLSLLLPSELHSHDLFVFFVGLSIIALAYSYRRNPLPFRIPVDAKAILFSLYNKQTSREIIRIEVSEFSTGAAGLYSLALSGISGILSEITQSREINAMITGKDSHVVVSAKNNFVAFMIVLGSNSAMPSSCIDLFLHSITRKSFSDLAIVKYVNDFLAPLFYHTNYNISHPLPVPLNG